MTETNIHPTAIIEDGAQIGTNVTIEPYAIIKKNVTLHDGVTIKSHAYIDGHTTIGEGTSIYPSASIGTKPQALKYKGEKSFIKIGKHCEIRESVTINSSLEEGSMVSVGDHCMIMAYCHLAHNSRLGNHVIMSNNAILAGHVTIEDHAIIGGMTPIHQYVRVGRFAMIGGFSRVPHDVPPYTIGAGVPFKFGGLNLVGLKRNNFNLETRKELSKAFKILYRSGLSAQDAVAQIERDLKPRPEVLHFIDFCKNTKRGLIAQQGDFITGNDILEEDEELNHAISE